MNALWPAKRAQSLAGRWPLRLTGLIVWLAGSGQDLLSGSLGLLNAEQFRGSIARLRMRGFLDLLFHVLENALIDSIPVVVALYQMISY
jgi:hypothetical protein